MIITRDCSVASAHRQESPARINPLAYSNETLPAGAGAPRSNHSNRGEPATNAAATTSVASAATSAGQAIQAPAIATQCSSSSIRTRTGPGVGTTTCRLSSLVEKTAGRPMSRGRRVAKAKTLTLLLPMGQQSRPGSPLRTSGRRTPGYRTGDGSASPKRTSSGWCY